MKKQFCVSQVNGEHYFQGPESIPIQTDDAPFRYLPN